MAAILQMRKASLQVNRGGQDTDQQPGLPTRPDLELSPPLPSSSDPGTRANSGDAEAWKLKFSLRNEWTGTRGRRREAAERERTKNPPVWLQTAPLDRGSDQGFYGQDNLRVGGRPP